MNKFNLLIVIWMWSAVSMGATAKTVINFDIEGGSTAFTAVGKPAMIRIKGEAPAPQGHLRLENGDVSGQLVLNLDDLKTGISLRDEHMKNKYLQTKEFPKAELTIEKVPVPMAGDQKIQLRKDVAFHGMLNLHGRNHSIEGTIDFSGETEHPSVLAHFSVPLSEYGIETPSYAGVKVSDHVEVTVDLKTKRK